MSKKADIESFHKKIDISLGIAKDQLNSIESQYQNITKKSLTFITFSFSILLLLLNFNQQLIGYLRELGLVIQISFSIGILLLVISVLAAFRGYAISGYQQINIGYKTESRGLFTPDMIIQEMPKYVASILKHYSNVVDHNVEMNNEKARWVRYSFDCFAAGFFITSFIILMIVVF